MNPKPKTKDVLQSLDVRPSKQRGQNFLIRPEIPEAIAAFGGVGSDAHVVEIGPGTGALTQHLRGARKLTLVEIEPAFCKMLAEKVPEATIVNQDVRSLDFSTLGTGLHVFGNIPYVFSTDIVFHLLESRSHVEWAVLMVQKEFAERLAASPGGREYGSISVALQLWADVELGPIVPGTAFHPPTAVESRVMRIRFLDQPRVAVSSPAHFERVVRAAFSQRRKKILNSMMSKGFWSKEVLASALEQAGLSSDLRAERLSVAEFGRLASFLPDKPSKSGSGTRPET